MVERAEREPVSDVIGTSSSMPLDMGCIKRNRFFVQANSEFAHRASIAVSLQYRIPKPGVTVHAARLHKAGADPYGSQDLVVKRRRKMGIYQRPSDPFRKLFIVSQDRVNGFRKASVDVLLKKRTLVRVAAGSHGDVVRVSDLPYTVVLQAPERGFRMHYLSMRAKGTQQVGELSVRFPVGHQAVLASETTPDSPQHEEGLVRRSLPS